MRSRIFSSLLLAATASVSLADAVLPPSAFRSYRDGIVVCDLAEAGVSESFPEYGNSPDGIGCGVPNAPWLFFRGEPMRLAGGPEGGGWYTFTETTDHGRDGPGAFLYEGPELDKWDPEGKGLWLYGYWSHDWAMQVLKVASIDHEKKEIRFAEKAVYGIGENTWGGNVRRFRSINSFEELDSPGEWWLDRERNLLHFYPPNEIREGDAALAWKPDSALYIIGQTNVVVSGKRFHSGFGNGIEIRRSKNVRIENCVIEGFRRKGVAIDETCENVVVSNCVIRWTGEAGVTMDGGDRRTLRPGRNAVVGCDISHFGLFQRVYAPAVDIHGCGQTVRGNRLHEGFHTAALYVGNEHLIERNDIYHAVTESGDAGALYSGRDWTSQGNVIRWNYIHDLGNTVSDGGKSVFTMGVYLDDCDCGDTVVSNYFLQAGCALMIGGGRDNRFVGNVIVDCEKAFLLDDRGASFAADHWNNPNDSSWNLLGKAEAMHYREEPWASRYPDLARILDDDPRLPLHNVFAGNRVYACRRVYDFSEGVVKLIEEGRLATNDVVHAGMPGPDVFRKWKRDAGFPGTAP